MDLKTSLLVNRQLPEFIREEYPLFISFLEAYYEFLEVKRGDQKNDLLQKLKDLKDITDVDISLSEFEDQFFNTFLTYLPKNTAVSADFLIKNILPLYQSKGTQKSFEFLFKLLYGEDVTIEYPREQILRASDGKWIIQSILHTETEIYSEYVSDGSQTVYNLPYEIDPSLIRIIVNGTLVTNYHIRKELKKIYFNSAPSLNSKIKIYYPKFFDTSIFKNRQIVGKTSGATTIVENIIKRNIEGMMFYEFYINDKNIVGTFRNGEIVEITVIVDDELIPFNFQTISDVKEIQVTNPGQSYNVGDIVPIQGSCIERAVAIIDSVVSGNVQSIKVLNPGRGYIATPIVDLTLLGDGTATANSILRQTVEKLPGRWGNDDGFLSSENIRLQGRNYFVDFSYVISSRIEFQKYSNIVKNLLNPAGTIGYGNYKLFDDINVQSEITTLDSFKLQLAGQVNVSANSIFVYGNQNVFFQLANTENIIREGTYILVNSEIRIVNSIINNTTITVSESFNYSSNNQFITIIDVDYNALTTEYWREVARIIDGPRTVVITTEE